ncbi:CheY-like superfamily [Penicillium lividum]|nr:CheY-like superfamily [Penicillium lividum]
MKNAQQVCDGADLRAREMFHYFQPDNPALMPTGQHPTRSCEDPITQKSSPNLVLTALAQLAAMKLGVQRTVISLIDRETLYVVAEASRSLNLANNDEYDSVGDGLWVGCSRGPVAGTLCEETITLNPLDGKHAFFIVEDLKQHPTYCNLPCVAKDPHFRYYAGTPLKTGNGINIGSLYVIDPRPDHNISDLHKETLGTIADAVMEYLETSRQSLEANRLTKLLAGLNTFVQGSAGSETSRDSTIHRISPPNSLKSYNSPLPSSTRLADGGTTTTHKPLPRSKTVMRSDNSDNRAQRSFQSAANLMRESLNLGSKGGVVIVGTGEDIDQESSDVSDGGKGEESGQIMGGVGHQSSTH